MAKYEPLKINDDQLAALDAEYDDVICFKGPEEAPWLCVLRRPTADEALAYKSMANDLQKKTSANVKLISNLSVFPKKDTPEWQRQYSRWPLFPDGLADNDRFKRFCGIEGIADAREK